MFTAEPWSIQPAQKDNAGSLLRLLDHSEWKHQHLDWLDPKDLIGEEPFLLCLNNGELVGCLACPPGPGCCAWIRIFAVARDHRPRTVWNHLWPAAFEQLRSKSIHAIAALILSAWLEPLLYGSGFIQSNSLIFLRWEGEPLPKLSYSSHIREARPSDWEDLIQLDQKAFRGLWMNSGQELMKAFRQAAILTMAENGDHLIGYQLSTLSAWGAHLSRLAVEPEWQGMGVGSALVSDLLHRVSGRGCPTVTVNTQEDNLRSIRLYRRLGFQLTGDRYPVLELAD
jgi:ribosomal protein S18 acetylase RimI-like enzyme